MLNLFPKTAINMFFKDIVSVNGHIQALKTAVKIEKIKHFITLFSLLYFSKTKTKTKVKQS